MSERQADDASEITPDKHSRDAIEDHGVADSLHEKTTDQSGSEGHPASRSEQKRNLRRLKDLI